MDIQDYAEQTEEILPTKKRLPKRTKFVPTGTYDGKELTKTCHRPGAYDFMRIPSMRNGERVQIERSVSMTSSVKQIANWRT